MSSTKRNTAHIRHQGYVNSNGAFSTTVAMLFRSLRSFPALLRKTILFSTVVTGQPAITIVPLAKMAASPIADTENVVQEQATVAEQRTQSALPTAAYLSMQKQEDTLHIAEAMNDTTAIHTLNNTETELFPWLQHAARQRNLKFIAAALRAEDEVSYLASRLWLQEDIVPYVIGTNDANYRPDLEDTARMI